MCLREASSYCVLCAGYCVKWVGSLVYVIEDAGQFGHGDGPLLPHPEGLHQQGPVATRHSEVQLLQLPDALHHLPLHGDLHLEAEGTWLVLEVEVSGGWSDGETGQFLHLSGVELPSRLSRQDGRLEGREIKVNGGKSGDSELTSRIFSGILIRSEAV